GQEHSFKPMHPVDFKGTWTLTGFAPNADEQALTVKVNGNNNRLQVELSQGEQSVRASRVAQDDDQLRFSVNLESFGGQGVY
ncbi:hypothetical protein, partial [Escherichia coli]|uniref:hypothetical protein n=1 Tax=Escherichia coli TaxID=562 RepID=UPI0028DE3A43